MHNPIHSASGYFLEPMKEPRPNISDWIFQETYIEADNLVLGFFKVEFFLIPRINHTSLGCHFLEGKLNRGTFWPPYFLPIAVLS